MREFLNACRRFFGYAFFFSLFINILQLTFAIYMLQVYDKVLTSYNLSTLAVITIAAVFCLCAMALLDWIRSRLLVRSGVELDRILSETVLRRNLDVATGPHAGGGGNRGSLSDVQKLRNFLGGNAIFCFFDAPWMPIYFVLIFMLHPALGMVAVCGGIMVIILGVTTERVTRKRLETATNLNGYSLNFSNAAIRNAGIVRALGMTGHISRRWKSTNDAVIALQTKASKAAGLTLAISKAMRMGLQVAIYAMGAYLAVTHLSTPGVMISASIVMGRALAPIDMGMATYRLSVDAWGSYKKLKALLEGSPMPPHMELPPPSGEISVENLYFTVGDRQIIKGISFRMPAGQSLAIIGPSAAGKSTLCKLMLNLWQPTAGKIRIDGADIQNWDPEKLGPYLGYLPQDVELFAGSIAENIARLGPVDSKFVIQAANDAGVHEMILGLPKGYDSQMGEFGGILSGGQRQRIGLARALYGQPKIIVLDEPNSNLDEAGEASLRLALYNLRNRGATVILVTHKPDILNMVDNIMFIQDGQIALCGNRQTVLRQLADARSKQEEQMRLAQQAAQRAALEKAARNKAAEEANLVQNQDTQQPSHDNKNQEEPKDTTNPVVANNTQQEGKKNA